MSPVDGATLLGTWEVSVVTPIGTLDTTYEFTRTAGALSGTATSSRETVPVTDVELDQDPDGLRAGWNQAVRWPIRLHLHFDVVVTGDRMSGYSRAGRLPRSRVSGTRLRGPEDAET
ncbi:MULTISPECIES: hypothetical protein [Pseudonocardia]|uniref:Lipocalin-like domain-containing protein n=1 Tax=Pseudonocardia saturnea TaxID=33909 RepID=A0ABQ0S124_9PSEU|nr:MULTISPECIES: hypothetical protein [Pseudonocardia]GEC26613.1 hypothetical protein PSA01_36420 [Pseudonocardia saturnea]